MDSSNKSVMENYERQLKESEEINRRRSEVLEGITSGNKKGKGNQGTQGVGSFLSGLTSGFLNNKS